PLTIKAGYVIGSVYLTASSIWWLNQHKQGRHITYIPRFLLITTCIELLGRCVCGVTAPSTTLLQGLRWIFGKQPNQNQGDKDVVVTTTQGEYTIVDLNYMRHFSAHGQATTAKSVAAKFSKPDEELLNYLLKTL